MQYANDTCASLVGRIIRSRPNTDRSVALDFLNDRLRTLIDRRPSWAGLLVRGVVPIPNSYTAGTITLTNGSATVAGASTAWPTNDIVNSTITGAVTQIGTQWVVPASMTGINGDSVLYCDASGTPELVAVLDMTASSILVNFTLPHNPGFSITQSSLAGLQLRMGSINPVFTVNAVVSATSLILDNPWGAATMAGAGYQIIKMYTTFYPSQPGGGGMKELLVVTDPVQQIKLRIHVSQEEVNQYDPNRTATDSPTSIVDLGPNLNGNQLYEIYPPQSTARQLNFLCYQQWRDMRAPGDRPPPFINPSILYYGALADALRLKIPRPPDFKDPWHNPEAADIWEARFERGVLDAINADNSKAQTDLTYDITRLLGYSMGSSWEQSHDYDAAYGCY